MNNTFDRNCDSVSLLSFNDQTPPLHNSSPHLRYSITRLALVVAHTAPTVPPSPKAMYHYPPSEAPRTEVEVDLHQSLAEVSINTIDLTKFQRCKTQLEADIVPWKQINHRIRSP